MNKVLHLAKRFISSLDRHELSQHEIDSVTTTLTANEFELWSQMSLIDKKHSVVVRSRFLNLVPSAELGAVRASLLHDVGKIKSNLSLLARVVATVIGSRGERFSLYHDHESIGAQMLREIGSEEVTCRLVSGAIGKDEGLLSKYIVALRSADDI